MSLSKDERNLGYKQVPLPTPRVTTILRRVAAGYISVTLTEGGPEYRYDDGSLVHGEKGKPLGERAFRTMVREGWLLPVDGGSFLEDGPPQQYRARRPADGPLPRVRGGPRG